MAGTTRFVQKGKAVYLSGSCDLSVVCHLNYVIMERISPIFVFSLAFIRGSRQHLHDVHCSVYVDTLNADYVLRRRLA